MPTNALTPNQMNKILHDQFREVADLGFTAEGVSKVFKKNGSNESSFTEAATALCSKKELINCILESCRGIKIKNLQQILSSTGSGCERVIENLYNCRANINELMVKGGFSASNISSIAKGTEAGSNAGIKALSHHKEDLLALMANGFSASNISSMLNSSGLKVNDSIRALINNQENLLGLMKSGFSASNISHILHGSRGRLEQAIEVLNNNLPLLVGLIQSGNFTPKELADELHESSSKIIEAIQNDARAEKTIQEIFLADLSALLFSDQRVVKGRVAPSISTLLHHRATLLQLKQVCGFSANHIAGMLKGSEADIGKAIGELSRKKVLLFGLINEGLFTADQLADKLHGSGVHLGEVFDKHPDIRQALHMSFRDEGVNAPDQDVNWLDDLKFFEVDDSDISVFSLDGEAQSIANPALKRPRLG